LAKDDKTVRQAVRELAEAMPRNHCDLEVPERVRRRLDELGLVWSDIAYVGGQYFYLPSSRRRRPSLHNLLRLAILLQMNPEYLAWGQGEPELGQQMEEYLFRLLGGERSGLRTACQAVREARKIEATG
jgi:hypothetical protein